jgi:chemosensory pili system protein ChpA (sensor histidine kinase/response regulator)
MSATTEFDVGPLTWVKGEIDLALNRAREHLAQFAQNPSDLSQPRFCLTHLHQVSGAIQMVGLEGVARFSGELENLVSALEKQEIDASAASLALANQAIAALSNYLDGLLNGEPYQPLSLFPLYSGLLRARGVERISEADLFFPDLGLRAPKNPEAQAVAEDQLPAVVKKERARFQRGLLGWLRQQNGAQGLQMMRKALHAVEQTQPLPANRTFWWAAGAFIESLINHGIEPDFNAKQLCARVDLQMRRLAEGSQKVAERLLRDVLYFVARSAQVSDRVREVKQIFELEAYLPPAAGEAAAAASAATQLQPLLRELRELLAPAKEAWLRFTSGNKDSLKPFQEQIARLHGKVPGLGSLPLEQLVGQMAAAAKDLPSVPAERMDAVAMDMATALLLAENALENFEKLTDAFAQQAEVQAKRLQASTWANIDISDIPSIPLLDEISRKAQEKVLLAQVVHEIQTNLRHIEQVLDGFFRDSSKRGELPALDAYIKQVMGAFSILELERAADLLKACQTLVHGFADADRAIEQHELELVADGLSSLGFYIEAVQHGRSDAYNLIEPVLKRCPGYRARAGVVEVVAEPEAAPAPASVEAGLDAQKRMAQERLELWQQQPDNISARDALHEVLTALRHDADLVVDSTLKEQAAVALGLLEQCADPTDPALAAAIATLAAPRAQAAPSAEATRLLHATEETVDQELLETYLEEAEEVLERVAEHTQICREQPHNRDSLTIIRRGFHTLKGSGRMVGLTTLGEVAWNVEQVMNYWLEAEKSATPALLDLLAMAHESFSRWVAKLKADGTVEVDADELLALAARLKSGEEPPPEAPRSKPPEVDEAPAPAEETEVGAASEPDAVAEAMEASVELAALPEVESAATPEAEPAPGVDATLAELQPLEPLAEMSAEVAAVMAPEAQEASGDIEVAMAEAVAETGELVLTEPAPEIVAEMPLEPPEALPEAAPETEEAEEVSAGTQPESDIVVGDVTISPGLFAIFLAEADHHIATLQGEFAQLREQPLQPIRDDFLRAAHTLCGIAATTGFDGLADLSHALEQWLQEILQHPVAATDKQLKVTGDAINALEAMVAAIRSHKPPKPAKQLIRSLQALLKHARAAREQIEAAKAAEAEAAVAIETTHAEAAVELAEAPDEIPAEAVAAAYVQQTPETDRRVINDDLDEQLLPIFMEEAQDLFPQIGAQLRDWRANPQSGEISHSLQRSLHTLKGSARMAGAMRLGELTHHMETRVVDATEGGELAPALFDELEAEFDRLGDSLERLRTGSAEVVAEAAATPVPASSTQPAWTLAVRQAPVADAEQASQKAMLRVRADVVDRLVNEAGEVSIARSRIEGEMLAFKQTLLDLTENVIRLRNQLRETEIQAESQMQSRLSHVHVDGVEFDPLEFDRFTRFQELTRMMAESVNDVSTVQQNLLKNLNETEAALLQQSRMTRDLQQELMRIRMVPMGSLAERLHRIVRQTAKELGKRANLEIRGAHVEIDRSVLEKMTAPFEHLLRNAIAHGLEDRAQRPAAKPEFGEIRLEARQQGNEMVLLFSDDGAGIDLEAIRARALDLGLLAPDADPTPAQLMEMIFTPGFSTAREVTQVSGRGIGMDVVRSEITGLGGRIEVASEPARGTTFTIYLPLTLAVTQAVLVRGGNHIYAIPSAMVEQVQELKPDALARLYETGAVDWQNARYPFSYLPRLLGDQECTPAPLRHNFVILLRSGAQHAAIHVDELLGNREVVVKNIGPQLARVPGIAGATVLGNGKIVMIINPVQLAHHEAAPVASAVAIEEEKLGSAPLIMVVDDSLTVRKITSRLLSREGYQVVTAKDGVDALQQIQNGMPDVMLVDIEMPRMDGFELTRNVRGDPQTAHIPIIMITSRTAEKHRNYARELGVNVYLGKPYQEDELLGHIASFLNQRAAA